MLFKSLLFCLTALLVGSSAHAITLRDVTYTTKDAGKVVFNHNFHIKQKGIENNCKACHDAIFDMKKKSHYTMAEMEQGKSCGACHGKSAFGLGECARCHTVKDITFKIKETGSLAFSHAKHVAKHPCGSCHPKLYSADAKNKRVSMAEMEKGKSCGACHTGKEAFALTSCGKCHPTRDLTYKVKDAGKVVFSHKFHTEAFKCSDCHTKIYGYGKAKKAVSMEAMEKGKSCGACHNGKDAFTVKANCATCHKM
jgi:c(7)-type cytochrome triheme protein